MTDMSTIASAVCGEKPSMTDCTRWRTSAGTSWTLRVSVKIGEAWVVAWVFRRHACHIAVKDGSRPVWYAGLRCDVGAAWVGVCLVCHRVLPSVVGPQTWLRDSEPPPVSWTPC